MDAQTAKDISKVFLQTVGAVKARIRSGAEAREAAKKVVAAGKTPTGIRAEFMQHAASGVVKLLNTITDDFNGSQTELRITMEDLLEVLSSVSKHIKSRIKK